jgi:hypothetical protein
VVIGSVLAIAVRLMPWFFIAGPNGWTDLSSSAPASSFSRLGLDEGAVRRQFQHDAAVAATMEEGRILVFEAFVAPRPWSPSVQTLGALAADHLGGLDKILGSTPRATDLELVPVNGVTSGRYTATFELGRRRIKRLVYVLPGRAAHAVLSYDADVEDFSKHLDEFDAAVRGVRGVANPLPRPEYFALLVVVIMTIAELVVAKRRPSQADAA